MRKLKHNASGAEYLVSGPPVWAENMWMCGSHNFIDTTGTEFSVVDWISDDELAEIAANKAQSDATTRAALILQIDDESDALIRAVIGERGHEYELAEKEALAFKASGYTGLVPSSVESWATAKGWTATQSADSIIAASVGWRSAQAALRASRLLCKEQAKNAANAIDMGVIRSGWSESLAAIKESLN